MKVLLINTVCGSGSVGKITADIYHTLKDAGEDGIVLYGRNQAPEQVKAVKIGSKSDFYRHALLGVVTGRGGFGSGKITERMIEKIKEEQPDIIHLHNIHGFYVQIEQLFSYLKEAKIPVVWTLHDCWSFTGHCAYFDYAGCDRWKQGCGNCPQHRQVYPYSLMDYSRQAFQRKQKAFKGVKNLTIVTPSYWLAKLVRQSMLGEYPVEVIPNGIELQNFNENAEGEAFRRKYGIQDKFVILGVANVWEKRKGLEHFVNLSKLLKEAGENEKINDKNTVIVLIGINDKDKKKLPKSIIALERTNGAKELAAAYQAADVYVNATLEDNFPTTNIEALACGTPVVTFDTGGSAEALNESCGLITKEKSAKGIYDALLELKRHPLRREDCLKRGREYDKNKRFEEYIALYRKMIEKNAGE